jgi:hypothetical protein
MKTILRLSALAAALPLLLVGDLSLESNGGMRWVSEARALIGRPLTPFSFAGVARRTTRRAIWATGAVAASSAVAVSAAAASAPPPQQAAPPAPPASAGAAPPVGAIFTSLPSGCVSAPIGGIQYYDCAGVFYRPTFQGNNLVYVVQKPS